MKKDKRRSASEKPEKLNETLQKIETMIEENNAIDDEIKQMLTSEEERAEKLEEEWQEVSTKKRKMKNHVKRDERARADPQVKLALKQGYGV